MSRHRCEHNRTPNRLDKFQMDSARFLERRVLNDDKRDSRVVASSRQEEKNREKEREREREREKKKKRVQTFSNRSAGEQPEAGVYVPPCHVDFSIAPTCWTPVANIRRSTLRCTRPRGRSRTCPESWSTLVYADCADSPRGTPCPPSWPYFSGTRRRHPCLASIWKNHQNYYNVSVTGIFFNSAQTVQVFRLKSRDYSRDRHW